jgi:hypothetical protein
MDSMSQYGQAQGISAILPFLVFFRPYASTSGITLAVYEGEVDRQAPCRDSTTDRSAGAFVAALQRYGQRARSPLYIMSFNGNLMDR